MARVASQVASQQARRSRTLGAVWGGVRATGRSMGKVMHQLWLEVIGALFLAMAAMGGFSTVHEFLEFKARRTTMSHMVIAGCFTVAFAWFGVSSFFRVRKGNSKRG